MLKEKNLKFLLHAFGDHLHEKKISATSSFKITPYPVTKEKRNHVNDIIAWLKSKDVVRDWGQWFTNNSSVM